MVGQYNLSPTKLINILKCDFHDANHNRNYHFRGCQD